LDRYIFTGLRREGLAFIAKGLATLLNFSLDHGHSEGGGRHLFLVYSHSLRVYSLTQIFDSIWRFYLRRLNQDQLRLTKGGLFGPSPYNVTSDFGHHWKEIRSLTYRSLFQLGFGLLEDPPDLPT